MTLLCCCLLLLFVVRDHDAALLLVVDFELVEYFTRVYISHQPESTSRIWASRAGIETWAGEEPASK